MTVQEIVNAVSVDMRQVLGAAGADANLIATWVDRIQKDMIRSSCYSYVGRGFVTFTTKVGVSLYDLGVSFRDIALLYDRTNNRKIPHLEEGLGPGEEGSAASTNTTRPNFFMHDAVSIVTLFPTPSSLESDMVMEVHYNVNAGTVALGTGIPLPDASKDVVVAGVNMLAAAYLKNIEEMNRWSAIYEQGKKG